MEKREVISLRNLVRTGLAIGAVVGASLVAVTPAGAEIGCIGETRSVDNGIELGQGIKGQVQFDHEQGFDGSFGRSLANAAQTNCEV